MLDVCQDWGGLTMAQWHDLPIEDRRFRVARHRYKLQPLTPERFAEETKAAEKRLRDLKRGGG